jgi:hypothetical protein
MLRQILRNTSEIVKLNQVSNAPQMHFVKEGREGRSTFTKNHIQPKFSAQLLRKYAERDALNSPIPKAHKGLNRI